MMWDSIKTLYVVLFQINTIQIRLKYDFTGI
jgi:hypothetical protein